MVYIFALWNTDMEFGCGSKFNRRDKIVHYHWSGNQLLSSQSILTSISQFNINEFPSFFFIHIFQWII